MTQMHEATSTPEPIAVAIPPEPAVGSVVLDNCRVAWQARLRSNGRDTVWVRAGTMVPLLSVTPVEGMKPWPRLLVEDGPVTLVYREGA